MANQHDIKFPELHDQLWLKHKVSSGATTLQISNELGCTRRAVAGALRRYGLDFPEPVNNHGHRDTGNGKCSRAYKSWSHMIQRCTNENNQDYDNYGGRGIKVCNRWFIFRNFLADMGGTTIRNIY